MKKLKLKSIIVPLIAVAFLTGCNNGGGGVTPGPTPDPTTIFTIYTDTDGIKIRSNSVVKGVDYVGNIIVTAPGKVLPSQPDSVILLDESSTRIYDYTYKIDDGGRTAEFKIPASDIINDIKVSLTLQDTPIPNLYTISTETPGVKIRASFAIEGENYEGTIINNASDKILPDELDSVVFDDETSAPVSYYYEKEDDNLGILLIPADYIIENIKVSLTLLDPPTPEKWLVSFNSDGGSFVQSQKVINGHHAAKPTDPTKKIGTFVYQFGGWYEDGETELFDFDNTPIVEDIILKARWTNTPPTFSYRFKFSGTNCLIGGTDSYEIDVLANASVQFAIVPEPTYVLPPNDEEHFIINTSKPEDVTYDPTTGVISISKMEANIEIIATSPEENFYTFDFQGTNCTVNNLAHYTKSSVSKGSNLSFTIVPLEGYKLPTFGILEEIKLIGGNVTYDDTTGIINITNMISDVTIVANAPLNTATIYTVSFDSQYFMASATDDPETASHQTTAKRSSDDDYLKLYIFTDGIYSLPDNINVTFDDGPTVEGDYYYSKNDRIVIIYRKANAMISIEMTEKQCYTVTLNAGNGIFKSVGVSTISFSIREDVNIASFIRFVSKPYLKDNVFAYYNYEDGSSVGYSDVLKQDISLKANYLNITTPYTNLDSVDWNVIKQVSVTNPTPEQCFQLGATKTVSINEKSHLVRIIDFNHDRLVANPVKTAGITFEFANVISDSTGGPANIQWDGNDEYRNYNYFRGELHNSLKKGGSTYNLLPDDIKEIMEPVIKKACISEDKGTTYFATSYETELFPLSVDEYMDMGRSEILTEGTKYEYYNIHATATDRIKKDANGDAQIYWTRSATALESIVAAWLFKANGDILSDGVNRYYAVAPAFCV